MTKSTSPARRKSRSLIKAHSKQTPDRMRTIAQAMRHGLSDDEIHGVTMFDPWFLARIREIVERKPGAHQRPAQRRTGLRASK